MIIGYFVVKDIRVGSVDVGFEVLVEFFDLSLVLVECLDVFVRDISI